MAVNQNNYASRGGNLAIVLRCPQIVADDRLVHFDYNKKTGHWVIRDFLARRRLDNYNSILTVAQMEEDATYDEYPVWCNVEEPATWRAYLSLRTTAVLRLNGELGSTVAPNPSSGNRQIIHF